MALMLEALDIRPSHRVLEVGTGTGYNAALLAQYLGDDSVVSVEVDADVAEHARAALIDAGYSPTVVTDDGANGYAPGAPYDRIIATCSAPSIPRDWIEQVRPGGLILTNLYRELGGGALVLLAVPGDGTAEGPILVDYGGFMPLRGSRTPAAESLLTAALASTEGNRRHSDTPAEVMDDAQFLMFAALHLSGVGSLWFQTQGEDQYWLLAPDSSWAAYTPNTHCVEQAGPRALWDEIERLHKRWTERGSPRRDELGLTVTTNGQHRLWQRYPGDVVSILPHCTFA
jgi:protein-L-isoaspartate(D-aspartate) O-methyltransferase